MKQNRTSGQNLPAVIKAAITLYSAHDMDVYAGYSTLFVITAVFPLIMLILSVVNLLPIYSPGDVTDCLFRFLPDLPSLRSLVENTVSNLRSQSTGLLASISALTTFWSASLGVTAVQKGLQKLYPHKNLKVHNKITALLFTLIYIVLIPAIILFSVAGEMLIRLVKTIAVLFGMERLVGSIAAIIHTSGIITAAIGFFVLLLTYTCLPDRSTRFKEQLPGTVFTALVWTVFTKLFTFFIPGFYRMSGIYGSLASLFLALLWLRIIMMIFFYGAALNVMISVSKARPDPGG